MRDQNRIAFPRCETQTMALQDHSLQQSKAVEAGLPPARQMTEEEFVAWCDEDTRAEWVDGEVIMMSPLNVDHADLLRWLLGLLGAFVEERDLGLLLPDVQVRLATQRSRRVPDIWFISNQRRDLLRKAHLEGPPDLIIEIVSPDSEARDWREKYLEYEAAGVREYWVIDPMSQHVEVYALGTQRPSEGQGLGEPQYRRIEEEQGVIASTVLSGFRLTTAWLWPETRPKVLDALRQLGLPAPSAP